MKSVLLILSASFCNPELQAEFGDAIPSCLVPVGPRTLLDLQVKHAKESIPGLERVFVGLPERFDLRSVPSLESTQYLSVNADNRGRGYTFAALMGEACDWIKLVGTDQVFDSSAEEWRVWVINGDTLVKKYPDVYSNALVVKAESTFEWNKEEFSRELEKDEIYCGAFCFKVTPFSLNEFDTNLFDYASLVKRLELSEIETENWLDFGHMSTYYRSKRELFSSRSFNTVEVKDGLIRKKGDAPKIQAEVFWYQSIPQDVAMYTPRIVANDVFSNAYYIEYLPYPTLAEIYVFGNKTPEFWLRILKHVWSFMNVCGLRDGEGVEKTDDQLLLAKTLERCKGMKLEHKRKVQKLVDYLKEQDSGPSTIVHGDLCFSNILYDARSDRIKVIDPRGLGSGGGRSVRGSPLYELAKLYHSACYLYDFAVAGREAVREDALNAVAMKKEIVARALGEYGYSEKTLVAMTCSLFYSMLPLHMDDADRVARLLKTAENLYEEFKEIEE